MIERRKVIIGAVILVLLTTAVNYGLMVYAPVFFPNSLLTRLLPAPAGGSIAGSAELNRVYQYIKRYYVNDVTDDVLAQGATAGLVQALGDPYSYYMDAKSYADFTEKAITGKYSGIGVSIEVKNDLVTVIKAFKGTPAETGGLRPGDQIVGVDDQSVIGMALDAVKNLVRGEAGTKVKLTVVRPGATEPLELTMTRATIQTPTVFSKLIDTDVAYIQLDSFDQTTDTEFEQQLAALQAQKTLRGLILDLRYNPGGTLEDSVNVAEYFVPSGPIVATVDKAGNRQTQGSGHGNFPFPVVVLVNEYSASASEVVAGALQDAGTATLVGSTTFGKGSVQVPIELDRGAALRLTIFKWHTPKDRTIDKVGINPDVVVARPTDETPSNMDQLTNPLMVKALEIIRSKAGK